MFSNSSRHSVDAKGRLFLPVRFRGMLGDTFIITKGFTAPTISIYTKEKWDMLSETFNQLSPISGEELRRRFFAWAGEVSLDGQGRMLLPVELKQILNIGNDVFVVGAGDHIEVWDAFVWIQRESANKEDIDLARLMEMGL